MNNQSVAKELIDGKVCELYEKNMLKREAFCTKYQCSTCSFRKFLKDIVFLKRQSNYISSRREGLE